MRIKLSKIAKDLNVGVSTAVEFLRKHNIEVDNNPNTRIDENAVNLLTTEFSSDKADKMKVNGRINERRTDRKERQEKVEKTVNSPLPPTPELRVVGKIDLESKKPAVSVKEESQPAKEEPKVEVITEKIEVETIPAPTPKNKEEEKEPEKVEAPADHHNIQPKTEITPEKPVDSEKTTTKEVSRSANEPSKETSAEKSQKINTPKTSEDNEKTPAVAEKTSPIKDSDEKPIEPNVSSPENDTTDVSPEETGNEVFRLETPQATPELKVLGKIDLSSLNQSTRPRKRSRDEKRKGGEKGKSGQPGGSDQGSDRKKRKRIGKEKIDIEKAASQVDTNSDKKKKGSDRQGGPDSDKRKGDRNRGAEKNQRRKEKNQRPEQQEDVQRQVKETLARLTSKAPKKGLKWRKEKREAIANRELENQIRAEAESKVIQLTEFVTANDLANLMEVPVNNVIATCMNVGVIVSINQRLDADTINVVAEEFGFTTEYVSADVTEAIAQEEDNEEDLEPRPPIVTVMGHVDHGKTSLLDYIRNANVIAGEAGGITQHIGAYNVKLPDGRRITFLDTPGHEAFTAMRARGAKVTDIAIIIVAADDDVMPQTIEAINHASAAGVPMVFAINKIDKPTANPDKIKEQLANMNYLVEDWGGKFQSQDISAKKGLGVEDLMEKVLLEAEMLELKANPNRLAVGSVIESSLDKGRGYVATVLVQNGTLKVGDVILAGTHYGKIKAMFNERNQRVKEAGPATPVMILGLNGAPTAGDTFNVMETEQEAREIAAKREQLQRELGLRTKKRPGLEELARVKALNDFHELNLLVKGDVDGSVEALSDSLIKLSTPEIQVNVLHKGVGAISESDVTLAAASDAIIIGFQVRPSAAAKREAEKEGVEIRLYSVIYKAIEEVKDAMEGLLSPEIKEEITGTAEVLQTYHISKVGTIAGAIVRDGRLKRSNKVRVIRDGIVIYTGDLGSLKRFKDDVKEVVSGYDCGLSVAGYNDIREGDLIEGFEEVEVQRSL